MELRYVKLKYDKNGLVPMIIQNAESGTVLSLFYASREAIKNTQQTGYLWRYSRTNKKLMKKGTTSGNYMRVVAISMDCDNDALLVKVKPLGPACHTGQTSCFKDNGYTNILRELTSIIADRKKNPKKDSYTSKIVKNREIIVEKLREELEELIDAKRKKDIKWEAADLLYFLLVYLENQNVSWSEVLKELKRRRK